ncbi:MAG: TIGR02757 family protein [Ignavibacteriales bacterium]|nr:TIGR02757 family protein [Ignavibacteriales bacterium]
MKLSIKETSLKKKLELHYKYFDFSKISPDPLEFPHRFKNFYDIEISAFISSIFAYGNVKQINNSLEKIHQLMNNQPHEFVKNYSYAEGLKLFSDLKHRFYSNEDIAKLFYSLNKIYLNYGSLKYFFLLYYFEKDPNLKNVISFFSRNFVELSSEKGSVTHGIKFMIPDPLKGSACKRMNLFLRWMVRKDELDFGLWNEIPASKLVIPVDTHVAKICKQLKLTKQKNVSWKMAEEITDRLKRFDDSDPVKYDFAICHIGMRKLIF